MSEASTERTLGVILGTLKSIEQRLDRADESRAGLYEKLDAVVLRMTHVEADMQSAKLRLDAMQEVHDDFAELKQRAVGAGVLGHWAIKVGIWVVAGAGWLMSVYSWLQSLGRPPSP